MGTQRTCECGTCAKCKHREYMKSWYADHREVVSARSREWYVRNAEMVRERVRDYRERNIERIRAYDRARGFREYDPVKKAARLVVTHEIERGRLTRKPCEVCGESPVRADGRSAVHAHHDDYSKPLDVRWLCSRHHGELHRRIAA